MPFTVNELHDLIRLLDEHPEWRTELRRVLLAQDLLDLPRTVQELAMAQRRTEEALVRLTERMEQGFTEAAVDRQQIRERVEQGFTEAAVDRGELRRDVGRLKGMGQEQFYRDRASAIFGRVLSQGRDATDLVANHLHEARRLGQLSSQEYQDVLAADLLWGGRLWDSRQEVVLVLEASWTVDTTDVERAARRAAVLRRTGLKALPVAAGQEWSPDVQSAARDARVAMVRDGFVDQTSWEIALASS